MQYNGKQETSQQPYIFLLIQFINCINIFLMNDSLNVFDRETGLYSENYLLLRLHEELGRHRTGRYNLAFISLEIPGFMAAIIPYWEEKKDIYNTIKHIVNSVFGNKAIIVAPEPHKFFLALPKVKKKETLQKCSDLLNKLQIYVKNKFEIPLKLHAGISFYPQHARNSHELIHYAELALSHCITTNNLVTVYSKKTLNHFLCRDVFVDRVKELTEIYRSVKKSLQGDNIIISISGGLGVGKTQLLKHLSYIFPKDKYKIIYTSTSAIHTLPLYYPLDHVIKAIFSDKRFQMKNNIPRLKKGLFTVIPTADRNLEKSEEIAVSPDTRWLEVMIGPLLKASKITPIIIAIDDFQYINKKSLEFFKVLLQKARNHPLAFIITHTYGESSLEHLLSIPNYKLKKIVVSPLDFSSSCRMLKYFLNGGKLDKDLVQQIYSVTKGNPFFMGQVVKYLYEKGTLIWNPEKGWQILKKDNIIPENLKKLIKKRIHGLSTRERRILNAVVVAGTRIGIDALQYITGLDKVQILDYIDALIKRKIINIGVTGIECAHPLFEKVIYEDLPEKTKKELHKKIANYLEKKFLSEGNVDSKSIAFHFDRGGLKKQAHKYYLEAAYRAKKFFNLKEASELFENALITATNKKTRESIQKELVKIYRKTGDYKRSKQLIQELLKGSILSICQKAELMLELSENYMDTTELGKAYKILEELLSWPLHRCRNSLYLYVAMYKNISWIKYLQGKTEDAWHFIQKAQTFSLKTGDEILLAQILNLKGNILFEMGELDDAKKCYDSALTLFKEHNQLNGISKVYNNISTVYSRKGLSSLAVEFLKKSRDISRKIGDKNGEAIALLNIGEEFLWLNDLESASHYLKQYMELSSEIDNKLSTLFGNWMLGLVEVGRRNYSYALEFLHKALQSAKLLGLKQDELFVRLAIVETLLLNGDLHTAKEEFQKIRIKNELETTLLNAEYFLIRFWIYLNEFKEGLSNSQSELNNFIKEAQKIFKETVYPELHLRLGWMIGEALLLIGQFDAARQHIQKAWDRIETVLERIGNRKLRDSFLCHEDIKRIKQLKESLEVL